MGFYKKTILLSNQSNYDKGMAILTIEKNNGGVFGTIKSFDIKKDNLVLGICANGKPVVKQNVMFINNAFSFKLNNFDLNCKIGCVLVEINSKKVTPIVWGTNGSDAEYKKNIIEIFEKDVEKRNNMQTAKYVEEKAQINEVKQEANVGDYNNINADDLYESSDEEVEEIIDNELRDDEGFLSLIKGQIDELFRKYPEDNNLQTLIPESKWVKIDYNQDGKEYVLGLIYKDNIVKYICYGIPGDFETKPPDDLIEYSQWIEVDGGGYWIMYQDATTGDNIRFDEEILLAGDKGV